MSVEKGDTYGNREEGTYFTDIWEIGWGWFNGQLDATGKGEETPSIIIMRTF